MRRHPLDPVSLIVALVTLAIAGAWFAWDQDVVSAGQLALGAPLALIAVGVLGVVVSVLRKAPRESTPDAPASEDPPITDRTDVLGPAEENEPTTPIDQEETR